MLFIGAALEPLDTTERNMVYAIQVSINGGWVTTNILPSEERAESHRQKVANTYGARARVKSFPNEAAAWRG